MNWQIVEADVLDWAASYDGPKFHACLCDPSYALSQKKPIVLEAIANLPSKPTNAQVIAAYHALQQWGDTGFMGRAWDSDVAFNPETWAALAQHLHPGAFIFAFASSRGWHRLAVAIEDAGMVIQPSIFGWCSSQAFPKATRIDTQIDKRKGYKPGLVEEIRRWLNGARKAKGLGCKEIDLAFGFQGNMAGPHWFYKTSQNMIPRLKYWPKLKQLLDLDDSFDEVIEAHEREVIGKGNNKIHFENLGQAGYKDEWDITAPATDLARAWVGHRYGGQVLKNALEPIICAQKPWTDPRLDCIVETGAGALWVDGGRIACSDNWTFEHTDKTSRSAGIMGQITGARHGVDKSHPQGRWPANFTLQHVSPHWLCSECGCSYPLQLEGESCPNCNGELVWVPGCQRVGVRKVKNEDYRANPAQQTGAIFGSCEQTEVGPRGIGDPDGTETVADWRCTESCPVRRLGEQSGEKPTPPGYKRNVPVGLGDGNKYGKSKLRHEAIGYGDTGTAARFFQQSDWSYEVAERLALADPVRYQAKAAWAEREAGLFDIVPCAQCGGLDTETHVNEHGRTVTCRRCDHPTVKPLSLNIWLATLLLPPPEYAPRRLLVPFAGTNSEGIGGLLAGWDEVVAIDNNAEYCQIAKARTKWWIGWSKQADTTEPKDILKVGKGQPEPDDKQLELEL